MKATPIIRLILCCLAFFAATAAVNAQEASRGRVLKVDAVELIDRSKEIEGNVDFQQQHGRYIYLFASKANLKTFIANPAKYEIQQGGACGRMGPLSGEGSPKLFAVHEGKLYLFASEQCKRTFIASPEKFIQRDDPKPEVDERSKYVGETGITMIAANGQMLRKTERPVTVRQRLKRQETSGSKTYDITHTVTWRFPESVSERTCWNESCWSNTVVADAGWSTDSKGSSPLDASQCRALMDDAGRHPWMLAMLRREPGFIAVGTGKRLTLEFDHEDDQECSEFLVHWKGSTTTLAYDGAGRCRVMSYRGRGPDSTIGEVRKVFSKFHILNDRYELPGHVETTFNGKPVPELSGDYSDQAVNDPPDAARFKAPSLSNP
jgi:YHS domain-containing protein